MKTWDSGAECGINHCNHSSSAEREQESPGVSCHHGCRQPPSRPHRFGAHWDDRLVPGSIAHYTCASEKTLAWSLPQFPKSMMLQYTVNIRDNSKYTISLPLILSHCWAFRHEFQALYLPLLLPQPAHSQLETQESKGMCFLPYSSSTLLWAHQFHPPWLCVPWPAPVECSLLWMFPRDTHCTQSHQLQPQKLQGEYPIVSNWNQSQHNLPNQ